MTYRAPQSDMQFLLDHVVDYAAVTSTDRFAQAGGDMATTIMTEAALSFLGLGMPVDRPSLGSLIRSGFEFIFSGSWWITFYPAMVLIALVLALNLLGDWMRDVLNPRLRR